MDYLVRPFLTLHHDDVGNRNVAEGKTYTANALNQYTKIDDFVPEYDADGNQTLIQTSTGVWHVTYNAENRPVRWQSGDTVITMAFDRMGRRVEMRTATSTSDLLQRFVYKDFLCVQQFRGSTRELYQSYVWDPTEPIATRPLVLRDANNTPFYYFHDGNKNVAGLTAAAVSQSLHYAYSPYGTSSLLPTSTLLLDNPFQFSSEVHDTPLALTYYNYRHYQSLIGRWGSRDPLDTMEKVRLLFCNNQPLAYFDFLGLAGDTTHRTERCRQEEDCHTLLEKTNQWKEHYEERWRELNADKYNLKENDPKRYNNHIDEIGKAEKNLNRCIDYLKSKCECVDGEPLTIPTFSPYPLPSKLPVPGGQRARLPWSWGTIDWGAVGAASLYGAGAAILAIVPFDGPVGETVMGGLAVTAATQIFKPTQDE